MMMPETLLKMVECRTTIAAIILGANLGVPPREIADLVGWKPESVSSILSRARANGQIIRRHPAGRPKTRGIPTAVVGQHAG